MEGRTVSHFRITGRLGGGGMGVVYKAIDTRLDRPVALKFLPPDLTRDDDARARLIQEAKAASALDHPNICTVHDIDTTPEGQLFIAMAFYDGETLKKRIASGLMTIGETLDASIQVAQGLAKAHAAGIIHRDIKPANLMVTADGVVKIVDFGIAKVVDQTGATRTGVTLGTVTYMSPEQLDGEPLDGRSDIWSLGATMYEMLTGKPPFDGDNAFTVMKAIGTRDPVPVKTLRNDVPDSLGRIVARAMKRSRADRQGSATELVQQLSECRNELTGPNIALNGSWRVFTKPRTVAAAAVLMLAIAGGVAWSFNRSASARGARERIGEISRLVEQDNYAAAFRVAEEIEPYLKDDPMLRDLWPRFSRTIDVTTKPGGARVSTRSYVDKGDAWRELGVSPITGVRVPLGLRRWKFDRDGAPSVELAIPVVGPLTITLEDGDASEVRVAGGSVRGWITGIDPIESVQLPDFRIGKYEVTNRQFKAFVQAGGYRNREYWDQAFVDGAAEIPFETAIARFVDATGRPGPATWELGDYPAGRDEFPVTGVSWYEAAAYAKSVGKSSADRASLDSRSRHRLLGGDRTAEQSARLRARGRRIVCRHGAVWHLRHGGQCPRVVVGTLGDRHATSSAPPGPTRTTCSPMRTCSRRSTDRRPTAFAWRITPAACLPTPESRWSCSCGTIRRRSRSPRKSLTSIDDGSRTTPLR